MKQGTFTAVWGFFFLISGICYAQAVHIIEARDFEFTPDNITVFVGDTVRWTNAQGHHNVLADDNSFTSGPPAPAPWTFNHVFTSVSTNPYYCEPHGGPGGLNMSGVVTVQNPVSVEGEGTNVNEYNLNQNHPNPFNPSTNIEFQIASSGFVSLKVYDLLGREIATLVNENKSAGSYEVDFDASNLSSGFYIYQLSSGNFISTKKMLLLK